MPDVFSSATAGLQFRGYQRGSTTASGSDQYVIPVDDKVISFKGRASTFVTPGRGAVQQRIFALHNATGSTTLVSINRLIVDTLTTVVKAVTVQPPIIRVHRFTALPSGGTALTKGALDSTLNSPNASVTVWGDSSSDNGGAGTSSTTALTITSTDIMAQVYGPRMFSGVGYEPIDTAQFLIGEPNIILQALQGVCVTLDMATVTTGNPSTDKWTVMCDWTEYTRP